MPAPSPPPSPAEVVAKAAGRAGQALGLPPDAGATHDARLLVVRLWRGLHTLMAGDEDAMRSWMAATNRSFGAAPAVVIGTPEGRAAVVAYVEGAVAGR